MLAFYQCRNDLHNTWSSYVACDQVSQDSLSRSPSLRDDGATTGTNASVLYAPLVSAWGPSISLVSGPPTLSYEHVGAAVVYATIRVHANFTNGTADTGTVVMNTTDASRATQSGYTALPVEGPGAPFNLTALPFGTACDCNNATRPDGYARVDFTGTNLAIDPATLASWAPYGIRGHGYTVLQSDQLLQVFGGGSEHCGCYGPPPTLPLIYRPFAASCAELGNASAAWTNDTLGGRYTLYWGGRSDQPFIAYCNGSATFLPLPNIAEVRNDIVVPKRCAANRTGTALVAQFRMVAIADELVADW